MSEVLRSLCLQSNPQTAKPIDTNRNCAATAVYQNQTSPLFTLISLHLILLKGREMKKKKKKRRLLAAQPCFTGTVVSSLIDTNNVCVISVPTGDIRVLLMMPATETGKNQHGVCGRKFLSKPPTEFSMISYNVRTARKLVYNLNVKIMSTCTRGNKHSL